MTYSQEYSSVASHAYTQALIQTGHFEIEHPYDVAPEHKEYSLTGGTLSGTDMIASTPLILTRKQAHRSTPTLTQGSRPNAAAEFVAFYHLGPKLCGHKGIVHGGLLATLMDECLCRCGFADLPNKIGVTGSLNIKYLAPTPANSVVVLHAWASNVDGRKVTVQGTISLLGETPSEAVQFELPTGEESVHTAEDFDKLSEVFGLKKTVWGEALVVEPKWAAKLKETAPKEMTGA